MVYTDEHTYYIKDFPILMCVGLVCYTFADLIIVSQYTKKILPRVVFLEIVKELFPVLCLSLAMGGIVYFIQFLINVLWLQLLSGIIIGIFFYIGIACVMKFKEQRIIGELLMNLWH